jgi:choloylglycine hydrolase
MINPRNLQKRAFVMSPNAAQWTSKYGSVTFNQFGREMPFGGMNEAGLVVENMWLSETEYPGPDNRPEINMLQWIQYQLDNHRTVAEVIASDKALRMERTMVRARIHYYICDASGDSAVIEFLNGEMRAHRGDSLPYRALANDTYQASAAYMRTQTIPAKLSEPLADPDSLPRFCRAAARAEAFKAGASPAGDIAYAFETLEQVRQGDYTVWQMVYDVSQRQVHFRTRSNPETRKIDLTKLDFDCRLPNQAVDIRAKASAAGELGFKPLLEAEHRAYLERFFTQPSLRRTIGEITPMIEPLLQTVQGYKCASGKSSAE